MLAFLLPVFVAHRLKVRLPLFVATSFLICITLHFSTSNDICHFFDHWISTFKSCNWRVSPPLLIFLKILVSSANFTRRPASADRTACRQFQATFQLVSRTQASDAMTSRLPRYEAKIVQRRCFQCGSVPLRSDIKGTKLPPANILIPLERQLIALQLCR